MTFFFSSHVQNSRALVVAKLPRADWRYYACSPSKHSWRASQSLREKVPNAIVSDHGTRRTTRLQMNGSRFRRGSGEYWEWQASIGFELIAVVTLLLPLLSASWAAFVSAIWWPSYATSNIMHKAPVKGPARRANPLSVHYWQQYCLTRLGDLSSF